jgi:hypothetical protein
LKLCNYAKYVDKKQKLLKRLLMMMMIPPPPKTLHSSDHCADTSLSLLNLSNNYCNILPQKFERLKLDAAQLLISCCMLPWQVHTPHNARSKEIPDTWSSNARSKSCAFLDHRLLNKSFSPISRSRNKKRSPFFVFRLRLFKKSFYS